MPLKNVAAWKAAALAVSRSTYIRLQNERKQGPKDDGVQMQEGKRKEEKGKKRMCSRAEYV